jgi:hypothetical protein
MRYLHLILPALFWSFCSIGQTQKQMTPDLKLSNISRYSIDYELKNQIFLDGDSSILNLINLEQYENLRLQSEDIEIVDASTEKIIILFSIDKAIARKTKRISLNQTREN